MSATTEAWELMDDSLSTRDRLILAAVGHQADTEGVVTSTGVARLTGIPASPVRGALRYLKKRRVLTESPDSTPGIPIYVWASGVQVASSTPAVTGGVDMVAEVKDRATEIVAELQEMW